MPVELGSASEQPETPTALTELVLLARAVVFSVSIQGFGVVGLRVFLAAEVRVIAVLSCMCHVSGHPTKEGWLFIIGGHSVVLAMVRSSLAIVCGLRLRKE